MNFIEKNYIKILDKSFFLDSFEDADKIKYYFNSSSNYDYRIFLRGNRPSSYFQSGKDFFLNYPESSINIHYLRQILGGIVGKMSNKYEVVHASGVVENNKGILFVGNRGSGKSTVSKLFSKHKILDDDILGIDKKVMQIIGKFGSVSLNQDRGGMIEYLKKDSAIKSHRLYYVFMLDRSIEGGFIKKVDNLIDRKHSVLNTLPKELQKDYLSRPPINVDAEVYVLGTKNNFHKTKFSIEKILF